MKPNLDFYLKNPRFNKGIKNCEFADVCGYKFCNQYVINTYDNQEICLIPDKIKKSGTCTVGWKRQLNEK